MKEINIHEELNEEVQNEKLEHSQKSQKKYGVRSITALGLALVLLVGSSFAYFSDYAAQSTTGTAGTLSIALDSDINLLDENGMDILNPGDVRSGSFTVTNMGNKSADIRTTIALTAYDRNGDPIDLEGSATTQSMYDLYLADDVQYVEGQGNKPKAGAHPLQTKNISGNVITYSVPEYSLDGNSDLYDEVETISYVSNGISTYAGMSGPLKEYPVIEEEFVTGEGQTTTLPYERDCNFVLVFNTQAGNEWQASVVRIDVIVEAKQHENTGAGWELVAQEDLTFGSLHQSVVLPENVITTNGTINPGYEYTPNISGGGATSQTSTIKGTLTVAEFYVDKIDVLYLALTDWNGYDSLFGASENYIMNDDGTATVFFEFEGVPVNTECSIAIGYDLYSDAIDVMSPNAGQTLNLKIRLDY